MVDENHPLFVVDKNDPEQILKDADTFFGAWFAPSDDEQVCSINDEFSSWLWWGEVASGLVQVYDLVAPLDPEIRAPRYLERLRRIAGALLDNRDDNKGYPADPSRGRVMPA